ncbi:MAG: hypothetical protein IKK73_02570 [Akkermansia sp.]|nr:hypothetical protein [Akkermansia sp.]
MWYLLCADSNKLGIKKMHKTEKGKVPLTTYNGAQGNVESLGIIDFSTLLNRSLASLGNCTALSCTEVDYANVAATLFTPTPHKADASCPVTRQDYVRHALFVKACCEALSQHMTNCTQYICAQFASRTPDPDTQLLMQDNEFNYKDDQLVSPKVIEEYTGYSDTTVRLKLSDAVCAGLMQRFEDAILDVNGKEQLNKKGKVRKSNPRYLWSEVKIVFGPKRMELLRRRDQEKYKKSRQLLRQYTA